MNVAGCWYCANDRHACSACGAPVEHGVALCEPCHRVVFSDVEIPE